MKIGFYLIVSDRGAIRTAKNRPQLQWGEIAVYQNLTLPDAIFTRPHISASVVIPDEAIVSQSIDAEVQMNAINAIEQATGLEVRPTIEPQEDFLRLTDESKGLGSRPAAEKVAV